MGWNDFRLPLTSSMGGFLKNLSEKLNRPIEINTSRLGAVLLLFALCALMYLLMIHPLLNLGSEYRETVADLQFKLGHLQQVASGKAALTQRLDTIKSLAQQNESFLPTKTAALASADLQTRIKQAVSDAGGELSSTQVMAERPEENAIRVGVKLRMTGSTPTFRQIFHELESGKPYLFIENLNVRPIRVPRNPRDKNPIIEDKLSVDFDVVGYMQAP